MLKFGVAGYPLAFNKTKGSSDRLKIFPWLHGMDLDALELQMTYGPRTKPEKCKDICQASRDYNITLSVHASYFIVLTSTDKTKLEQSFDTLKRTFDLCGILDARVCVLHPGPYYKKSSKEVLLTLEENLRRFYEEYGEPHCGLFLETAGKKGQLGSVAEILEITSRIPECSPCIDFGHVHARTVGSLRTQSSVLNLCRELQGNLNSGKNSRIHFHYTPINYGPKGEIVHKALGDFVPEAAQLELLGLQETDLPRPGEPYFPRPEPVVEGLGGNGFTATVISETHDSQEEGATV